MQVLSAPAGFGHSDCERIVDGALAQPVLAVTSLAYVAAGIAVLCWAIRLKAPLAGTAGVALVAVGAGSVVFHGPQPSWAGLAHDWPILTVGALYAAGLVWTGRRQWRSVWAPAAGVFALGLAAYAAGRSGSPLCRPDSLWQYHGAWHVLSAVAAGWIALAHGAAYTFTASMRNSDMPPGRGRREKDSNPASSSQPVHSVHVRIIPSPEASVRK